MRSVAAGLNFIDTADTYSTWVPGAPGRRERGRLSANGLSTAGKRDHVVIATKVGAEIPGQGKGLSKAWIMGTGGGVADEIADRSY